MTSPMIDADDINNILSGQLDRVIPLQPTVVKIYVCANHEEFNLERKYLWQEVLPDLQQHCLQYGIDIMFVDMLLGNQEGDPKTARELEEWTDEIERCYRQSIGPFFLAFLGDQYGNVSVPDKIDKDEFEDLLSVSEKETNSKSLLRSWYELDDNSIPPAFVLKKYKETKSDIYADLLRDIQTSSRELDNTGRGREEYFVSSLERQIKQALRLDPGNSVFVFKSKTVTPHVHSSDITKRERRIRLKRLKEDIMEKTLQSNVLNVTYPSEKDGEKPNIKDTDDCLENFITLVVQRIAQLIDKHIEQYKSFFDCSKDVFDYQETVRHLHQCVSVCKESSAGIICDQYISKIQAHLINGSRTEHQLCIVKGPEGCGKSSILAKACFRARELFGKDAIIVPIFVGLTEKSLLAEDVFRSICSQIDLLFKQEINLGTYTLKKLYSYFRELANRVSKSPRHLLVFIDGIEKLQFHHNQDGQNFDAVDWLAMKFPAKFHLVVTCCSSEQSPILKRLESKFVQKDICINIGCLSDDDSNTILNQSLLRARRKLTDHQLKAVLSSFSNEGNPLVVIYNSNKASQWHSTVDPDTLNDLLPTTVDGLIDDVLAKLEATVGKTIAKFVCSYIALSRYGLTEVEICDTLSENDEVLLDAHPLVKPDIFRFPCIKWCHIMDILKPLLGRRYVGEKTLLTWSNRRCVSVVRQRYLIPQETGPNAHRDLANLFLEQWNTKDPFDPPKEFDVLVEEIDRLSSPQPLVYNDYMYNKRKVHELWFHLLKSGDIGRFKEHAFCNFEYLLAMLGSDNIRKVMYNLDIVKSSLVDEDIHILDLALKSSVNTLASSTLQLANELIGRLRQIKDLFQPHIERLVMQCMEWCDNYTSPLLVPLTTWLDNVHTPLVTSMTHDHVISCAALMPNGQHVIVATDTVISMYHLATRRHVKSFKGHNSLVVCLYLDPVSRTLISGASDQTVCLWNIDTEVCTKSYRDFKTCVTCVTYLTNSHVICGTDEGHVVVRNVKEDEDMRTLTAHRNTVTALQLCKGGTILISSSKDGRLILWFTAEWSKMNVIEVDMNSSIICMDVSVDSTFLVAGCSNGELHVIAMATGTVAQTLNVHTGVIRSVKIYKDCHHCVAASSTGDVFLYNFRATEILDVFKGHKSEVFSVMKSDSEQLAFSVSKHEVCVWSLLKSYTKEKYTDTHSGTVNCLKLTPDAKRVVSGGMDGLLKTWILDISDFADNFIGHSGPVTCLDIANDNSFLVSGSSDMTLKVWNMSLASVTTLYKGHDQVVSGVHVLSDNRLVLSLDVSQKIHMWRAEDGQTMRLYAGPTAIHAVASNSQHCISGAGDNKVQIWKMSDGSVIKEISHTDKVTCLLCSSDSKYLVSGSLDRSVKVWELDTGKIVQIIVEHSAAVRSLKMTTDNETIISAGDDGIIHVCTLTLGTVEKKLLGHVGRITSLELTADDCVLVSGCLDNTVRVWNHKRGTQLTLFDAHYPVVGLVLTEVADRIALQVANNNHVPILCLHNSPAKSKQTLQRNPPEVTLSTASVRASSIHGTCISSSGSRADMSDFSSETLPIKPRPCQRTRVLSSTVALKRRRESSVSSIPQIIQFSPMKAPIQATVKAQEKRRLKFPLPKVTKPKKKTEDVSTKKSNICVVL